MIGLFVHRWGRGTKSVAEVDAMLEFCDKANITDIFLHCHEDIACIDDWNYFEYALQNCGTKKIHAWFSLTLGRNHNWQKAENLKNQITAKPFKSLAEGGLDRLKIDCTDITSCDFFASRIETLFNNNPTLYGCHVERLDETSNYLINKIRDITQGKYLSVNGKLNSTFYQNWNIDEFIPMIIGHKTEWFKKFNLSQYNKIILGTCYCNLSDTTDRLRLLKNKNISPIIYSYNDLSSDNTETDQQFIEVLNAIY